MCGNKSYKFDRTDVIKNHYLKVHRSKYFNHNIYEVWNDFGEYNDNADQEKDEGSSDQGKDKDNMDREQSVIIFKSKFREIVYATSGLILQHCVASAWNGIKLYTIDIDVCIYFV